MGNADEIYLRATLAYCDTCGKTELARIVAREEGVFMERACPVKGVKSVIIARDPAWYRRRIAKPRKECLARQPEPSKKGCPLDCGPCARHTGGIHLPIFSITNDCNLNCPICFTYNRPDKKYYMSVQDVRTTISHIIERTTGVQLINLTGGEPTMHPALFDILDACRHASIGRITMDTNGIRIGRDRAFAERIKEAGVQVVLSLHTLDPEKSRIIVGTDITREKRRCLETLEELDIPTTLLPACIKGVNEAEVARTVNEYFSKPFVKSITIQNMTYTGRNGRNFEPREHITMDEVETLLSQNGSISPDDFFPLGSYHPLCYSAAYYIMEGQRQISLTRIVPADVLTENTERLYHLSPEGDFSRHFQDGINRIWAEGADDETIGMLRRFFNALYPKDRTLTSDERKSLSEDKVKMIYIHPHMDADNFDVDRVSHCGDMVHDGSGRMIPACSYNLLYRQKDPRFWIAE
jgi:7,8-dihydro-6-hydroxymethylpterin dimethyltransferase